MTSTDTERDVGVPGNRLSGPEEERVTAGNSSVPGSVDQPDAETGAIERMESPVLEPEPGTVADGAFGGQLGLPAGVVRGDQFR